MREWRATIDAVDERMAEAIDYGLFAVESEHTITVPDQFDSGAEFIEVVSALARDADPAGGRRACGGRGPPVRVPQEVRLRVLRALLGSCLDRKACKWQLTVSADLPS